MILSLRLFFESNIIVCGLRVEARNLFGNILQANPHKTVFFVAMICFEPDVEETSQSRILTQCLSSVRWTGRKETTN